MKVLVISDTHRFLENAEDLLSIYSGKIKDVIHLGDMVNDCKSLMKKYGNFNFYSVAGNNDYDVAVPYETMVTLGGKKLLLTHGYRQRVNYGLLSLGLWAEEKEADAVLFGHIHQPVAEYFNNVLICNPGSLSLPRNTDFPTFGILDIDKESGAMDFALMGYMGKGNVKRIYKRQWGFVSD